MAVCRVQGYKEGTLTSLRKSSLVLLIDGRTELFIPFSNLCIRFPFWAFDEHPYEINVIDDVLMYTSMVYPRNADSMLDEEKGIIIDGFLSHLLFRVGLYTNTWVCSGCCTRL